VHRGSLCIGDDHDLAFVHPARRCWPFPGKCRGARDGALEVAGTCERLDVVDRIENRAARSASRYAVGRDEEEPIVPARPRHHLARASTQPVQHCRASLNRRGAE
jgi:hypothetical protein